MANTETMTNWVEQNPKAKLIVQASQKASLQLS
jgi:hypothetical protein